MEIVEEHELVFVFFYVVVDIENITTILARTYTLAQLHAILMQDVTLREIHRGMVARIAQTNMVGLIHAMEIAIDEKVL